MALVLDSIGDNVQVIASLDSALAADLKTEEYQAYLRDLDESHLRFNDGERPTYFMMRRVLPYKASQRVMNQQVRFGGEDGTEKRAEVLPGFILEEVRCSLVSIKHPDSMPEEQRAKAIQWKADADGYTSKELIALLNAHGVVSDLYAARSGFMSTAQKSDLIKKK